MAIDPVSWPAAGDRSGSTRAGPLQPFLVAGATGGHRSGGAGQQLVIGQVNTRAGPLQLFLVTGATGGHRSGGAGQQLVIGQVNTRAGPCSGSWSPAQPVAIDPVGGPAAGERSGSTRAGPLQSFLVAGAAGGHRSGGRASCR
ncbi:hypothetical protein [Aeromonas enteropelogenes]|uniref:hypothetical protein n=1 Tax=Aeromonas enteropelogenes TaxID=29489 RepID=UPI003BA061D8